MYKYMLLLICYYEPDPYIFWGLLNPLGFEGKF